MPPIKRTQKPGAAPGAPSSTRRLAGHGGSTRPQISAKYAGTSDNETRDRDTAGGAGDGAPRRRPRPRTLTYAALSIGLVAGVAGGGVLLATPDGASSEAVDNLAFVDQAATDQVLTAATTNVQRLVAIDHEKLDEYHDSLGEFLTPALVEELDKNWSALRDSYEQTATTVDAQVSEAGLSYLQGDKAEVLLVQDVSMMRDGTAAGSTSGTYLVGLDKVDGVWKLSRIPDLPS